jgi:hypothetical protein
MFQNQVVILDDPLIGIGLGETHKHANDRYMMLSTL